jgi:bacillithiol synthase
MVFAMRSHCLPFQEIPRTTELFTTFVEDFQRVSVFYAHPPTEQGILDASREVRLDSELRRGVMEVLREQNSRFGVDESVTKNLARLANGAAAIVTGQQVGLFCSPLYCFFKAVSAIRFAQEITSRGTDVVPIFWLASEDHDVAEVNQSSWRTRAGLTKYELPGAAESEGRRVGEITFGEAIEAVVSQASESLEGPFAGEVARALRESYTRSENYASGFGNLMARMLAGRGLIFIDPLDDRLHRFASHVFRQALNGAVPLSDALVSRSKELETSGFHAQVKTAPDSTLLFYSGNGPRVPVRRRDQKFLAGDAEFSHDELDAAIESTPEAFSPSVLLRPVMQDALLPTVAYIGGPSEVAYMAQAQVAYERILGRMPAILPRSSFTLVEPAVARTLSKYDLDFRDLLLGPQHVRARMEQKAIPSALGRQFESDEEKLRNMLGSYSEPIEKLDKSLLGTLDSVREKMLYQFTKLKEKIGRAENFRTGVLDGQERLLVDSLFPNRDLQERTLCALPFIAAYGIELIDEWARLSSIPKSADGRSCAHHHHVLFL